MHPSRRAPAPGPSRRAVLRLLGLSGLAAATAGGVAGCSAADREALQGVDPRQVRVDEGVLPRAEPPDPSRRERRRRAVHAGSLAALTAFQGAGGSAAPVGRTGGTADLAAALEVHRAHAAALAGPPASEQGTAGDPSPLGGPVLTDGGPTLPAAERPRAVLRAGQAAALRACLDELDEDDAQVPLALLHAQVAAARAAQAAGLEGDGASGLVWPTEAAGVPVLDALQGLLAQEHRARWSYAVVQAWSSERSTDAEAARADHSRRTEQLTELVRLLGGDPVRGLPTYPTDDAGLPVDGPPSASALALRLEDDLAAASAAVLAAALTTGGPAWVRAAVRCLAEAERARWSWGGTPVPWPGGGAG